MDAAQARNTKNVTIGGATISNIDPNDGLVYAFNNLSPTSGNLTISFTDTGAELCHINALKLTAIPSPPQLSLVA